MNKLERHRRAVTAHRLEYEMVPDARKIKRHLRQWNGPLYDAYILGQEQAYCNKPNRNPFPPGRRHDEYELGYRQADPMGDWHGNNA